MSGEVHTDNFYISFHVRQRIWKRVKEASGKLDGVFQIKLLQQVVLESISDHHVNIFRPFSLFKKIVGRLTQIT